MANYLPRSNTAGTPNYNTGNYLSTNTGVPQSTNDPSYYPTNQPNYNQNANYTATNQSQFGNSAQYSTNQPNLTQNQNANFLPPPPVQTNYTSPNTPGQANYMNTQTGYTGQGQAQSSNYLNTNQAAARPVTTQFQASPTTPQYQTQPQAQNYQTQTQTPQYQATQQYQSTSMTGSGGMSSSGGMSGSGGVYQQSAGFAGAARTPSSPQIPSNPGSITYTSSDGSFHSYNDNEKQRFVEYINTILANDTELRGIIPINPIGEDIFKLIGTTSLLCKIVNAIRPGTINERKIPRGHLGPFQLKEALEYGIHGCKDLGCHVVNISVSDLQEGKPHLILGLIWQCVKAGLLSQVNLREHPELVVILDERETIESFTRLTPEANLLRWFNFHLGKAQHHRRVNDFSYDIKDGENYLVLLEQLLPHIVPKGARFETNPVTRAHMVCDYAKKAGCGNFVTPKDILDGNDKLNLAFTAHLFNAYPGLSLSNTDVLQQQKLEEAEAILRRQFELELKSKQEEMARQERLRQQEWEREQHEKKQHWEEEERKRREQLRVQEELMRARMTAEEARLREWQAREEEARRQREREAEEQRLLLEEQLRRHEEELERVRKEEEERRRQFEAQLRMQYARQQEEEQRRRMEEQQRREEEERRRRAEEEQRRREEEAKRQAEEERRRFEEAQRRAAEEEETRRRAAWDAHLKEQANKAMMEEEMRRRAAWDDYARQQEAAKREEEARKAAWDDYNRKQAEAQYMATLTRAQSTVAIPAPAPAPMMMMQPVPTATVTTATIPTATVTTTTTVPTVTTKTVTRVTTAGVPSKWPIDRLIITVIRGRRFAKNDKLGMKSDPYVVLIHRGIKQKTTFINRTQDPIYNQEFTFRDIGKDEMILLQVWDKELVGKDDFMGEVKIFAKDVLDGNETWFPLEGREHKLDKVHGDVLLRFKLCYDK